MLLREVLNENHPRGINEPVFATLMVSSAIWKSVSVSNIHIGSHGGRHRAKKRERREDVAKGRETNRLVLLTIQRSCGDRGDRQPFTFWQAYVSPSPPPLCRVLLFLLSIRVLFLSVFSSNSLFVYLAGATQTPIKNVPDSLSYKFAEKRVSLMAQYAFLFVRMFPQISCLFYCDSWIANIL